MSENSPLIIIGSPRSGTNMLRDALVRLPGLATWPCDEINPIWRHGNLSEPTDEFGPELARTSVRNFINDRFRRLARRTGATIVVEKTCANSLRIPFVDRVFPTARYLFIHRDPFDAVASAMLRWNAPMDWSYTLRKSRFVPWRDLPRHAVAFLLNRANRHAASGRRRWWGPRFAGMDLIGIDCPLEEVCALQWRRCVELASAGLACIPCNRRRAVSYETFVRSPGPHIASIAEWLGLDLRSDKIALAAEGISIGSVGKGRRELGDEGCRRIARIVDGVSRGECSDE